MQKKIDLSIIVVSYRNAPVLELCLKSILNETERMRKKSNVASEIIVVDSEAGEKTRDIVKKFILENNPIIYCPFTENTGFSKSVNRGIRESQGKYLFILNYDIIITEGSLGKMCQYLKTHRKTGILGPKLLNFDGSPQPSAFHFYTPPIIL